MTPMSERTSEAIMHSHVTAWRNRGAPIRSSVPECTWCGLASAGVITHRNATHDCGKQSIQCGAESLQCDSPTTSIVSSQPCCPLLAANQASLRQPVSNASGAGLRDNTAYKVGTTSYQPHSATINFAGSLSDSAMARLVAYTQRLR